MWIGTTGRDVITVLNSSDRQRRSTYPGRRILFAQDISDDLNHLTLGGVRQSNRARQADRLGVQRIGIRTRRAAGKYVGRRAMNRLPERARLDFPGAQLA